MEGKQLLQLIQFNSAVFSFMFFALFCLMISQIDGDGRVAALGTPKLARIIGELILYTSFYSPSCRICDVGLDCELDILMLTSIY